MTVVEKIILEEVTRVGSAAKVRGKIHAVNISFWEALRETLI
jgi:hypothetical protein